MSVLVPVHVQNAILKQIADAPGSHKVSVHGRAALYYDMLTLFRQTGEIADIRLAPSNGNAEYVEPEYSETD